MSKRDDFSPKVKEALAKRVGVKCSNPDCRKPTSGPSDKDILKHTNIGVASHICAASPGGPRYDMSMSSQERASFDNGIWLCQTCAKIIDDDVIRYTKELLSAWKKAAEDIARAEMTTNTSHTSSTNDNELIKFYVQCFDRPAFQHKINQEGSMDDFYNAIEDTIIALNTGVQRTRDRTPIKTAEGKSMLVNSEWRDKLGTIVDMLVAINHRLKIAERDNMFKLNPGGYYCFNDREIATWFDHTRIEILKILSSVCKEADINSLGTHLKPRCEW